MFHSEIESIVNGLDVTEETKEALLLYINSNIFQAELNRLIEESVVPERAVEILLFQRIKK